MRAVVVSLVLGGLAGFFAGRLSVPHSSGVAAGSPAVADTETPGVSGGRESVPGAPVRSLEARSDTAAPLTSATLRAELAAMESGNPFGMGSMRKWGDLQDRLKNSDLPAIAAEMCAASSPQGRESGLHLVLSTYAESDPQGAWNLARGIASPAMRQAAIMAVVTTIAQSDPTRALGLADSLAEPQIKRQIRQTAVASLARSDPQRALALANDSAAAGDSDYSLSMIFSQWARKDPESAKAALAKLEGRRAEQARTALVASLAQQDPQAAWAFASSLPSSGANFFGDPRMQAIQSWAQTDPQSAIKAALTISQSGLRSAALATAVSAWAGSDFPAALKYAVGVDDPAARGQILQNLSRNPNANRRELLDAVLDHVPPGDHFQQAVSGVLASWAGENPAEAAAAAMELPAGRAFSSVAGQIAAQWMNSAPDKQVVFDWVKNLPEGEARQNGLRSIFSTWSATSPQEAVRALSTLPAEDRKSAVQALASGWSRTDPQAVIAWSGSLADASERADIIRSAVSQWAGASPEAAATFVERLPASEQSGPMESLVGNWASKDTESAAAWLDRRPAGPAKDAALRTLSRKIAQEDPEAALTWVNGISDEKERLRQTESIARDWIRQNPTEARAWVSTSTLPEDLRRRLLK
jgi:hypothetical protein